MRELLDKKLNSYIESGSIRNPDFLNLKKEVEKYCKSRLQDPIDKLEPILYQKYKEGFESYIQTLPDPKPRIEELNKGYKKSPYYQGDYFLLDSISLANLNLLLSYYHKIPDTEIWRGVKNTLGYILPLIEKLELLKPIIQKGRIPSESPVRTLERTGTCGICGKNVKLDPNGNLWSHGYTLNRSWGMRTQNCFGTGYLPIEVSNESLKDYIQILERYLESIPNLLSKADAKQSQKLKFEQKQLPKVIQEYKDQLSSWSPKPLPK